MTHGHSGCLVSLRMRDRSGYETGLTVDSEALFVLERFQLTEVLGQRDTRSSNWQPNPMRSGYLGIVEH